MVKYIFINIISIFIIIVLSVIVHEYWHSTMANFYWIENKIIISYDTIFSLWVDKGIFENQTTWYTLFLDDKINYLEPIQRIFISFAWVLFELVFYLIIIFLTIKYIKNSNGYRYKELIILQTIVGIVLTIYSNILTIDPIIENDRYTIVENIKKMKN